MRLPLVLTLGLTLTLLVGCSKPNTVDVSVSGVAIASQTDEGAVIVFRLDAGASGDAALSLKEVRYTLSIDGRVVFSGVRYAEATATLSRPQTIEIPAPVRADAVDWPLTGVRPYRISGSVAFLRPGPVGEMLYDLGLKRKRARFAESGGLDFGGAPAPVGDQAADSASASSSESSIDEP